MILCGVPPQIDNPKPKELMEILTQMSEAWSKLLQTILWISLIVFISLRFREILKMLAQALIGRIQKGAPIEIGPVSIGAPPEAIQKGEKRGVTSEGVGGVTTSKKLIDALLKREYPEGISDEFFLIHSWEVLQPSIESSEGNYRIRVWLEGSDRKAFDSIKRITYRLPDTFPEPIISTEARGRNFELWLNSSEEFNILAHIERKNNSGLWLNRHLTLPGRPSQQKHKLPITIFLNADVLDVAGTQMKVLKANDIETVVIPIDEAWKLLVEWEIPALEKKLSGRWELRASFESIIGSDINLSPREMVPLQSTTEPRIYTRDIQFSAGLIPSGVYSTILTIKYLDSNGLPGPMAGFHELGLIRIHNKSPYDISNPFGIPVRAIICNIDREPINVIFINETWIVHVEWETPELEEAISGTWEVELFLMPLGGGQDEIKLSKKPVVAVKQGLKPATYAQNITIEPGCIKIGTYKFIVVVKNLGDDNKPTNLAGFFLNSPLIQFQEIE